ncbi:MAG: PilW family protein [Shewanella algae]
MYHIYTLKALHLKQQRGVTLIELLISIALGLMTIAVAISALMVSRGISGTVSDASNLQQQAAYAFRVIGQQVRQAGSAELSLGIGVDDPDNIVVDDKVAFISSGFQSVNSVVSGIDNPTPAQYMVTVGFRNYNEANTSGPPASLLRDCLGQATNPDSNLLITSSFTMVDDSLRCLGSGNPIPQPIIKNVVDFQVNYLLQQPNVSAPTMLRTNAAGVAGNWDNVYAIEVCLELVGDEPIGIENTATYMKCDGTTASYDNRLRMVFRNTYQIRSQGLLTNNT